MSYQYTVTERRRRTTSPSYGASSNRSTFGYWVPLVLTVGAAVVGVAAWVWSERREDDEDSDHEQYSGGVPPPGYASMSGGMGPPPPGMPPGPGPMGMQQGGPPGPGMGMPPVQGGFRGGVDGPEGGWEQQEQDTGLVARMSSALGMGRSTTPNPTLGWASQQVAAGFAAAGAMVGSALGTARESDQTAYRDHERWSEEAEQRDSERERGQVKGALKRRGTADEYFSGEVKLPTRMSGYKGKKRRTVAIVVSAVESGSVSTELGNHAVSLVRKSCMWVFLLTSA
jgi:hypothetical protein